MDQNGERREVDPGQLAQYDQMEAHFQDLTSKFMHLREDMKQAALSQDTAALAALTGEMDRIVRQEWPHAKPAELNFIMYLIHLVEQARVWTDNTFSVVDTLLRHTAALARPDHPLHHLPGWDTVTLDRELDACQEANHHGGGTRFTTDTGVTLHNVHPEGICEGPFCVIHRPAPGPWNDWDTHWREDWKLMVRICPHDVQHVAIEERLRLPLLAMFDCKHGNDCDCACDQGRCETITDTEGGIVGFRAIK